MYRSRSSALRRTCSSSKPDLFVDRRHARRQETVQAKGVALIGREGRALVEERIVPSDRGRCPRPRAAPAHGPPRGRACQGLPSPRPTSKTRTSRGSVRTNPSVGQSVRGQVSVSDDPDQNAVAIDDREAEDEGGANHRVGFLERRIHGYDDRVDGHQIRNEHVFLVSPVSEPSGNPPPRSSAWIGQVDPSRWAGLRPAWGTGKPKGSGD